MFRLLLVLIPGLGIIHRGRTGRGVAYFFLFANLLNLFAMGHLLVADPAVPYYALGGACLVWAVSVLDALRPAPASSPESDEEA